MSEMIKRVGAAIGCIDFDRCNGKRPRGSCAECLGVARATIEAMREPTKAMIEAGNAALQAAHDGYAYLPEHAPTAWCAMIDEALK